MKLTTREKILITVLLGALCSWLFGCGNQEHYVSIPSPANGITDAAYLERLYPIYNEAYFQNRLTKTPVIDMFEESPDNMADTMCQGVLSTGGTDCMIHFSDKFTLAPRVADFTLLHEMCHIKMWRKDVDSLGQQIEHGRSWRGCMVQLDTEGAFRQILIDNYVKEIQ